MTLPDDRSLISARLLSDLQRDPASGRRGDPPNFGHDVVPHIYTESGRYGVASRAYVNMDEALRDSSRNAERMRSDCGIKECLEARQRATALLPRSIEPEKEGDAEQKQLAAAVTDILQRTPRFVELRRNVLEALWYGRYAIAKQYGRKQIGGRWRTAVGRWEPRHGDKLVFRYDDGTLQFNPEQVGIRVSTAFPGQRYVRGPVTGQPTSKVQPTEQGLVYRMDRYERETLDLHKHQIEDGPWGDPLMAGRIHGVGIRDRIYWTWYAMIECLQRVVEYFNRAAFGIEVWLCQAGTLVGRCLPIRTIRSAKQFLSVQNAGQDDDSMRVPKPKFTIRAMLILVGFAAAAMSVVSLYPHTKILLHNERWVGYYTGLGLTNDRSLLGYRFYKYTIDDSPYRHWEIHNDGSRYGLAKAWYPSGQLAFEGTCPFEGEGQEYYPLLDEFDAAVSYRPDGSVAAVMEDGTGKCLLFFPSGEVQWEMEYRGHERLYYKLYNEGNLKHASPNAPEASDGKGSGDKLHRTQHEAAKVIFGEVSRTS